MTIAGIVVWVRTQATSICRAGTRTRLRALRTAIAAAHQGVIRQATSAGSGKRSISRCASRGAYICGEETVSEPLRDGDGEVRVRPAIAGRSRACSGNLRSSTSG